MNCLLGIAPAALAVEVLDLWKESDSNAAAFRQKYVGQSVTVSGNVFVIVSEVTPAYLSLSGKDHLGGLLICTVGDKASLLPLAKGAPVTVQGVVQGIGPAGIQLKPCTIQ